jgi:hypothetical protein
VSIGNQDPSDEDEPTEMQVVRLSSSSAISREPEVEHSPQTENKNKKGKGPASGNRPAIDLDRTSVLGRIVHTSIKNGLLGLDWALIEITDNVIMVPNQYWSDNKFFNISGFMKTLPSRSPILAITERGHLAGTILGTAVSLRLPGSSKMCEVWTVHLNEPIGMVIFSLRSLCRATGRSDIFCRRRRLWNFGCQSIQRGSLRTYRRRKHWHGV